MKCPQCEAAGLKSHIQVGYSTSTSMGTHEFYDKDGRHHHHDPNTTTTTYSCSNGHNWAVDTEHVCWCQKQEIQLPQIGLQSCRFI